MGPNQPLIPDAIALLLAITIVGIVVRGRVRLCRSFPVYLGAVLLGNRLTVWWPETFHTHTFWLIKGTTYTALTGLMAFEVAALTFIQAPRARRRVFVSLGVITLLALVVAALRVSNVTVLWILAPQGETAALWMMATVMGFSAWHRIPLHIYHRAIIVARTLFLTFDVLILGFLAAQARSEPAYMAARAYFVALDPLAFAACVAVWAWASWRPLERRTGMLARLQPWAA